MHTNELINEHEIMQQAYAQANEVVTMASKQAQEILDNATIEANNVKSAAMQYMMICWHIWRILFLPPHSRPAPITML